MHVIEFLFHLGHAAGDRLLVIWDRSPIHRRAKVGEFLAQRAARCSWRSSRRTPRILNPVGRVGGSISSTLRCATLACWDLEELHLEFHLALGRLRQKPDLVRAFFAQAGLKIKKT